MSSQSLSYILNDNLSSNKRLKVYYDFKTGSIITGLSGSSNYAFLKNSEPSYNTGLFNGIIVDSSSTTLTEAKYKGTGLFLANNGSGYFPYSNVFITGSPDFNSNDCSLVINFSNEKYSAGVLFGSFEKTTEVVNGQEYFGSKGFNLGVNDRGKLFFQSLGKDGEYMFTANSIELSRKNIIGLLVGNGQVQICRFDYLNQDLQSEIFNVDTDYIKNPTKFYIGSSPNFYKGNEIKTFSGWISDFAIFSGNLSDKFLYNFGSGFISEYLYNSPPVNNYQSITGYISTALYATGITGYTTGVTGYRNILSGYALPTGAFIYNTIASLKEGTRVYKYFSGNNNFYREEVGVLHTGSAFSGTYNPTGSNAFDTLGLQNASQLINFYNTVSGKSGQYVSIPLYGITNLTGYTNEITGYGQTPLYENYSITGVASSGNYVTGDSYEYKKDYIYYIGKRI